MGSRFNTSKTNDLPISLISPLFLVLINKCQHTEQRSLTHRICITSASSLPNYTCVNSGSAAAKLSTYGIRRFMIWSQASAAYMCIICIIWQDTEPQTAPNPKIRIWLHVNDHPFVKLVVVNLPLLSPVGPFCSLYHLMDQLCQITSLWKCFSTFWMNKSSKQHITCNTIH